MYSTGCVLDVTVAVEGVEVVVVLVTIVLVGVVVVGVVLVIVWELLIDS